MVMGTPSGRRRRRLIFGLVALLLLLCVLLMDHAPGPRESSLPPEPRSSDPPSPPPATAALPDVETEPAPPLPEAADSPAGPPTAEDPMVEEVITSSASATIDEVGNIIGVSFGLMVKLDPEVWTLAGMEAVNETVENGTELNGNGQ